MQKKPHTFVGRITTVYAICFAIGVLSHAKDFALYGARPYDVAPLPIEVFWSSLILIDALMVVILLSRHKRLGCYIALLVMMADVSINTYALLSLNIESLAGPLVLQSIFLGVILGSIGFLTDQHSAPQNRPLRVDV